MPSATRNNENNCGYFGRILIFVLGVCGIIFSAIAAGNCQFLKFDNLNNQPAGLDPPFDSAVEAYVGIFSYKIIRSTVESDVSNSCVPYENRFGGSPYEVLTAAQFCSLFAPLFAFFALVVNGIETLACNFFASFLIASIVFLTAAGVQAGTFALYADPQFCFEEDAQECNVSISVYLSGIAVVCFWCCCLLICCFPRPDPVFSAEAASMRQQNRDKKKGRGPRIIVQPIMVEDPDTFQEKYGDTDFPDPNASAPEPKSPTRRPSKTFAKGDKITDDDFKGTPTVKEGSRVEVKEKTFPDGRRQVEEITHYPDGTKSVKTNTYKD